MFEAAVFYVFGAVLLVSGLLVITSRNPVHAALFLVLAFFTAAGIWLLLRAEFLAIALVVVYVGALCVLFLCVGMLVACSLERVRGGFWTNLPVALVVGGVMVLEMIFVLYNRIWGADGPGRLPADYSNTKELGRVLYTQYVYAFEIAAIILLVAIISAIALTLRRRKDSHSQDPSAQSRVKRADRVRLVSMPSEKE